MPTFYATIAVNQTRPWMPDVPYLLPASSWATVARKDGSLRPPNLPPHVKHVAADCGGFVATLKWGDYRYTPQQYVDWLRSFAPAWAATMDYCCEDEITSGKPGIVRERQRRTTDNAQMFFEKYLDITWVPTVQGWTVEDYIFHARQLKPVIDLMQARYQGNPHWRVGIGTLCARASTQMIQKVVTAVAQELPGVPLHLWGVKLTTLKSKIALPQVISVDSAAWMPGGLGRTGIEARDERRVMGMKQMEHALHVALPRYVEKFENAIAQPKQPLLI
jgi:hypothetical protein